MCGIVGAIARPGHSIDPERLDRMNQSLEHRGPDGYGTWIAEDQAVGLGHRRLSILDLSPLGAQPMHSRSGRYVLTFNGEIYNFAELRDELEGSGYSFKGHSDTEVILGAFDVFGVAATLPRLQGMFALGIWDRKKNSLTLVRDRIGIKPLYYGSGPRGFCFGSELKPLMVWQGEVLPISSHGLTEFLRLGYVPAPLSIFEGIYKLMPGHSVVIQNGVLGSPTPFWELSEVIAGSRENQFETEKETLQILESALTESVASHMVADVPLGAFLSGGIDSSTVVALMQRQSTQPIRTFSIGFYEEGYNEAEHAAAIAKHLGTAHTELYITDREARDVIPDLPDMYDEPFADQSQIPTYLVSKLAREDVTVALSGDGGDELFGGYNRYIFVEQFWRRLSRLPVSLRRIIATALDLASPGSWDQVFRVIGLLSRGRMVPALPGQKIQKIASVLSCDSLLSLHSRLVSQWANPELVLQTKYQTKDVLLQKRLRTLGDLDSAEQQMYWDACTYMVDDVLTKVDRASMRVGLEARVPLLDHKVVELAWRIPLSMKLRNGQSKWILRQILYKHVPQHLIDRPKMGFSVPVDSWLRGGVKDWAESLIAMQRLSGDGFFAGPEIHRTWKAHQSGAISAGGQLWTLLMFQAWYEKTKKWL